MPRIWYEEGFSFSFYSSDGAEPPHVHVTRGDGAAKWWLRGPEEAWSSRFKRSERARIGRIIVAKQAVLLEAWRRAFGGV